jgi:hypothetical protein
MRAFVVAAACLWASAGPAFADGGTLRLTRAAGPFVVTLFTAPEPLVVGSADVSVLVQERSSAVVRLDATVALRVRAPDGTEQQLQAVHATTGNRLLQSALVELSQPGRWQLTVEVRHGSEAAATVSTELLVGSATPRLAAQWPPLALPPLCIALYLWRARLLERQRSRREG